MKTLFVSLLVVSMICSPIIAQEQYSNGQQAIVDATRDAKQSDQSVWALVGCCGGMWGIAGAYIITPDVPPQNF